MSIVQSLPVTQILQTTSSIWLCLTDLRLVNLIDPRPLTFHDGLDVDDFRNLKFSEIFDDGFDGDEGEDED